MSINQLKPAEKGEIAVYNPYYPEKRRKYLGYAISLYKQKSLEGARSIEGGENIPFIITWNVSMLPADITRFRMQFNGNQELSYELTMANYEFIDFLIDSSVVMGAFRGSATLIFELPSMRKRVF